jgi:hypothetical protein
MLGPAALAEPLEAHVWQRVGEGLLDPALVAEGLTAAREQNEAAVARGERLNTLDREIGRLRVRLERIVAERLDADTGSEAARALKALGDEAEATIARLLAERADSATRPRPRWRRSPPGSAKGLRTLSRPTVETDGGSTTCSGCRFGCDVMTRRPASSSPGRTASGSRCAPLN